MLIALKVATYALVFLPAVIFFLSWLFLGKCKTEAWASKLNGLPFSLWGAVTVSAFYLGNGLLGFGFEQGVVAGIILGFLLATTVQRRGLAYFSQSNC